MRNKPTSQLMSMMRAVCRFGRCKSGAAALEFAIISVPFFSLLFALFQVPIVFVAQQVLETGATESARLIMTGQAQSQNLSATQFQQLVCANAGAIFNCSGVYVNVQQFSSFSAVQMLNPVQNGNFNAASMNYNPGAPGNIEVVQVFYQWPVYAAFIFNLANVSGGKRLLVATAAFRNEP